VEHPGHLPPGVRVRAVGLPGTGVADLRPSPVAGESVLHVGLGPGETLALGALPGVEVLVEGEAGGPVELGAAVRGPREGVDGEGERGQKDRVAGREQGLRRDPAHDAPTGSWGSVTSVKRISSGSSITSCFTV